MKFLLTRSAPGQRLEVPRPAQKLTGLADETRLEIHTLGGAVLIAKSEMTAMEMVDLAWSLMGLFTDMIAQLGVDCGECDNCGICECLGEDETVVLPSYVLEAAGLPPDCKLTASVDEDGNISVYRAEYDHDLSDIPPDLLEIFRAANCCIHELGERLMDERIVYPGESGKKTE
jgi:hypothetical protein